MPIKIKYLFLLTIFIFSKATAQSVKFDKKALIFLKSANEILVEFDYSDLTFSSDKKPESNYLEHRKNRLNNYKDSKGDKWLEGYTKSKTKLWRQQFIKVLNERLLKSKKKIVFSLDAQNPDYKLIVKTQWMYLGYDIGIFDEPAKIKLEFIFVTINEPKKTLSTLYIKRARGVNKNIENDDEFPYLRRVGKAYEKSAFMIYLILKKFVN
ncbi:MAG: hypothetical protein L3J20_06600 [Flavobacteriaceae bacterium]|nr:hypothetical protein [Flavobacteriaceae bacterium]